MALLILIGLVLMLVVYISLTKKKKRALLISAVVLGIYILYVVKTCGPNRTDVKVMKPMAEAISQYIMKNGVTQSLKDIQGLPYGLVGCDRQVEYWKTKITGAEKVKNLNDATGTTVYENCKFIIENKTYYVNTISNYEKNSNINEIDIHIGNKQSGTGGLMVFSTDEHKIVSNHFKIKFSTGKTSGICNPMRQ